MNTKNVKVQEFWYDNETRATITDDQTCEMQNDFHGEYDVDWLIVFDKNGHEIRRVRADKVLEIVWENKS